MRRSLAPPAAAVPRRAAAMQTSRPAPVPAAPVPLLEGAHQEPDDEGQVLPLVVGGQQHRELVAAGRHVGALTHPEPAGTRRGQSALAALPEPPAR